MTTESKNTAGELLRQGRLKQRLSIAECAKRTHIASRFLEALEEEQWTVLPSESHRLGFISLYSKFLGVPADDVLKLYKQQSAARSAPTPEVQTSGQATKESPVRLREPSRSTRWSPTSIPQLIALAILLLLSAWIIYHTVSPRYFEQNTMPWSRRRVENQSSRLVVQKSSVSIHKIRLESISDSWLRVTSNNSLLYEGILPARSVKEWSGTGPYQFKIGNVRAVSLFWNDQSVDIQAGSRGAINEIRIPPQ